MNVAIDFAPDLLRKYDRPGPRYTSYPTAVQFHEDFGLEDYLHEVDSGNRKGTPLSLYFHLPFCAQVCFYCGCNKIVTANRARAQPYLDRLYREMALQAELFDSQRPVEQLHWGGGTPTFISDEQMRELIRISRDLFVFLPDDQGEYSVEIDPREAGPETIVLLRELGFNRISLGVQDVDIEVQRAVNRVQPLNVTEACIRAAREQQFRSISLDLIYGLPKQTAESFERTLDVVIDLDADRLSVFNYAHLPELFKVQRQINAEDLPSPAVKLKILQRTIQRLTDAGYVYIGMDHFAKPDDELALAQQQGTLQRNFQGYSTCADSDLIGLGITSIGHVGDSYSQNLKTLDAYYGCVDKQQLPLWRGVKLNHDDRLRRAVITQLICQFELNFTAIEDAFDIRFSEYFQSELKEMEQLALDGLVDLHVDRIRVCPAGRLLIRNICMVFDRYLSQAQSQRFSRAI
jgi:oxygen-independent coproporphyrinogen-3 oxidase